MSLYRKYRPQSFSNLVGQEHVRITLMNALANNNVNHAYLFTGPRGTGKTSTARLMAKAINCQNLKDSEPCETCDICRDINEGRLIDLIEIDAASNRSIDEMRDLKEKIQFSPTRAKSKVYIIDEVHMLTKEAFNALLKTLEEPPAHVYFILATTEVHKLPETIISRCQRFDFKRIEHGVLVRRLQFIADQEKIEADRDALEAISRSSQGGLRDAIGLLEQLSVDGKLSYERIREVLGISRASVMEEILNFMDQANAGAALEKLHEIYNDGMDLTQFNKDFLEFLRQKMLKSVNEGGVQQTGRLLELIDLFQKAYEQMRFSTITQLPLEMAIIRASGNFGKQKSANEAVMQKPAVQSASAEKKSPELEKSAPMQPMVMADDRKAGGLKEKVENIIEVELPKNSENIHNQVILSFEDIKKSWPQFLAMLTNPRARTTLQTGKLTAFEANVLRVTFQTQFHLNKIRETENRNDIEKTLTAFFKVMIKFDPVLSSNFVAPKIEYKEETMLDKVARQAHQNGEKAPVATDAVTNQLLELLGGELVQ